MDLSRALAFSHYAERALKTNPASADELAASTGVTFAWETAEQEIGRIVAEKDPLALARALRVLRRRAFLHAMVRDLAGSASVAEVCGTMTRLAEVSLTAASSMHGRLLRDQYGEPRGTDRDAAQELIVIGMGKLGGGELNVSSDIDLIFAYPEEGDTTGPREIANREFFDRLGQRVIAALNDVTPDGYVFRVDMRLRPYGDSGPLTTTFVGLETYLVTQGRAWERYAWLKARALTGSRHGELQALVNPFVYRKYLDYDAYEGLRDVHRQIREQGVRRDYLANVKLGEGGIREIEFIAQALQIVRGGREPALQVRGTMKALAVLAARGLLPQNAVTGLLAAYDFLRRTEHRLQYRDDQQTHQLPSDPEERARLADAMGAPSLDDFDAQLARHRAFVTEQFAQVLGDSGRAAPSALAQYTALWEEPAAKETARATLAAAGFADPDALQETLARVRESGRYLQLPALSRQRFDALMPQLLAAAAADPGKSGAQAVFGRLLALLETVSRRSAYLALIIEHPPLMPRIAHLMAASAWAAAYLGRHPLLLDELLDLRVLLAEPDWNAWRTDLTRALADHAGDAERQMDALRHFQHAQAFRLLAQDIGGHLTVERLADHLSALADVVLDATLAACWTQMAGADAPAPRFAIVGYGKLGGKELGYASDLDLVFLYDIAPDDADAEAQPERYARLAQRVNTWLTSNTAAGQLYDTDLRLRPDGASGLMVSSLGAFRRYQRETAWTWEHQALTRARFVAGDRALGAAFEAERDAILRSTRDRATLARDVIEMRRRMFAGHPNRSGNFDLKHDPGGMVDIEFVVQYLVLAHAHLHPQLTRNAGNIALLHLAAELGLVPPALARETADAYRAYRRTQHEIRLTDASHARVEPSTQVAPRAAVTRLWTHVFGEPWQPSAGQTPTAATGTAGEIG